MIDRILEFRKSAPLLLRVGLLFLSGISLFLVLIPAAVAAAVCDCGHFEIQEKSVSGPEFLALAWPMLLSAFALGTISALTGFCLVARRGVARVGIILWPILIIVLRMVDVVQNGYENLATLTFEMIINVALVGFTAWYLYIRESTIAFFSPVGEKSEI